MSLDEESELLPRSKKKVKLSDLRPGIIVNRILLILLLVAFVAVSVVYQYELTHLSDSLSQEQQHAKDLDEQLQKHQSVIDRFNSSITNTDVLGRLSALETSLHATRSKLEGELVSTKQTIQDQLEATLKLLNDTVAQAENEIRDQVERVKKDVEQYVVTTQDRFSMENSFMVYQLAGTFTLLSCLISMWHMTAHLRKMNQPDVQRKILAILWMSPIYAVTSWFSLVFPSAEGYLAIIKDGYEAYIIYQFLSFCIAVLGKGDREAVVDLLALRADHLTPPFRLFGCFEICCSCCKPDPFESNRALADAILLQCQLFAMQFVFLRPLTTTAMVVLGKLDYYGAGTGPSDYRSPQFYVTIVQNISIFTAFAGLLKFYHAVDSDLEWCRPFAKFLCIKGVVFMTFWQGLVISLLAQTTDVGGKDSQEWASSAQNFLICLEMLLFSIAHFYCFPTEEWQEGYKQEHSQGKFGDSIALRDFFQDLKLILGTSNNEKKKKHHKEENIDEAEVEQAESPSEGNGSNNTEVLSAGSSGDLNDEERAQRKVARALEKSLGAANNDPDIVEAKKRLLESGMLSPEFFEDGSFEGGSFDSLLWSDADQSESDDDPSKSSDKDIEKGIRQGNENDHQYPNSPDHNILSNKEEATGDSHHASPYAHERDKAPPSESTELLPKQSPVAELLRPSIFTTVATIAESEAESEARPPDDSSACESDSKERW